MYSLKTIFKQEPSAISAVLVLMMNVAVLAGVHASKDLVLAVNAVFIPLLSLFYIRPLTSSKDALNQLNGESVNPVAEVPPSPPAE